MRQVILSAACVLLALAGPVAAQSLPGPGGVSAPGAPSAPPVAGARPAAGQGRAPEPASPVPAAPAPDAVLSAVRPPARRDANDDGRRCDATGTHCITVEAYVPETCAQIDYAARAADLDVGFFARLLWQESLFDANAVSPAGALGIAQFIPSTAALRELDDPFNPVEAIWASARYLAELEAAFGSLGLAAVAYNAGESRAAAFLGGDDWLPAETENYVTRITGQSAQDWRAGKRPEDLRLDPALPFRQACVAQARGRGIKTFRLPEAQAAPWGAILVAHTRRAVVERKLAGMRDAGELAGEEVSVVRRRMPGRAQPMYTGQIGHETQLAAAQTCARLRARGTTCIALRNTR